MIKDNTLIAFNSSWDIGENELMLMAERIIF